MNSIKKPQSESALGLPLQTLESHFRANYTPENIEDIHEFLSDNKAWLYFAKTNPVTRTTLRQFDLTEIRAILGCDRLKYKKTTKGLNVQAILDEKIRAKLCTEYRRFFQPRERSQSRSRSATPTPTSNTFSQARGERVSGRARSRSMSSSSNLRESPNSASLFKNNRSKSPMVEVHQHFSSPKQRRQTFGSIPVMSGALPVPEDQSSSSDTAIIETENSDESELEREMALVDLNHQKWRLIMEKAKADIRFEEKRERLAAKMAKSARGRREVSWDSDVN